MTKETKPTGLDLLRLPFEENQISKLPKGTKAQNECDAKEKINCRVCGGWHHPKIIHLDYVGHAALNDRLLDCDPEWNWEPVAFDAQGQPLIVNNSMWIKLTVCNVTRYGFGDAQGKTGANAIKEIIGDALRNAAMRFGAALDLWHKGDLHAHHANDENLIDNDTGEVLAIEDNSQQKAAPVKKESAAEFKRSGKTDEWIAMLDSSKTIAQILETWLQIGDEVKGTIASDGVQDRAIVCAKEIIANITDIDILRDDMAFNTEKMKAAPFKSDIRNAYIAQAEKLTPKTEKAA